MKNKINDVRDIMIRTMEELLNPEEGSTMDTDKAKAIAELGKVVVDSAKAEVMFMRLNGGVGTGFFPTDELSVPKRIS